MKYGVYYDNILKRYQSINQNKASFWQKRLTIYYESDNYKNCLNHQKELTKKLNNKEIIPKQDDVIMLF
jgi:hypothetical protein